MNAYQFFVVIFLCLLSVAISATEVASMKAGRFTIEFDNDGGQVVYGDNYSAPQRPMSDFGPWKNQIFIDSTSGQLVLYVCSFTDLGELASCSPKLVDTVITPDPASLPEDVVVGFVRNINLDSPSFEMIWHVSEKQESVWSDARLYGIVGPVSAFWTKHSSRHIFMKTDAVEQLLRLLGPETLADTAVGGVMVFLLKGDGKHSEQGGIANTNTE